MGSTPKPSDRRVPLPEPSPARHHGPFRGEVVGVAGGALLAFAWDSTEPSLPVETEVMGPQGFYARCIADQLLPEPGHIRDMPDRACGMSMPVPPEAVDGPFHVIVGGTLQCLPHRTDHSTVSGPELIQGEAQWQLLVHRLFWDLTGRAAPADRLLEESALLEHDPVTGTSALVRRLSAGRPATAEAAPPAGSIVLSVDDLVAEAYRGVLHRDPEPHGYEIFGGSLRSVAPLAEVIKALIESAEFQSRWNHEHKWDRDSDTVVFEIGQFIAASYRAILRREPEPEAFNIFGRDLRAGADPSSLIDALLASDEYQALLKREHAPTIRAPDTFSFTAEQLVEFGYRIAFKREPEPAGYQMYGNALRDGMNFRDFVGELLGMPESLSAWGNVRKADLTGQVMVGAELTRLSASIERSLLTLAMGAALGAAEAPDALLPSTAPVQVTAAATDGGAKATSRRGPSRRGKAA